MILSLSHRLIFVHIHKCGGESVETMISPYLTRNDLVQGSGIPGIAPWEDEDMLYLITGLQKHSSARSIKTKLQKHYDNFFTFATVRRPDARLYSLYCFSIGLVRQSLGFSELVGESAALRMPWPDVLELLWKRLGLTPSSVSTSLEGGALPVEGGFLLKEDIFQYKSVLGAIQSPTFSSFLEHPATQSDPAFAAQWSMVSDENSRCIVNKIIRLEDLRLEWPSISSQFDFSNEIVFRNSSKNHFSPEMNSGDIRTIEKRFHHDYELLGYEKIYT